MTEGDITYIFILHAPSEEEKMVTCLPSLAALKHRERHTKSLESRQPLEESHKGKWARWHFVKSCLHVACKEPGVVFHLVSSNVIHGLLCSAWQVRIVLGASTLMLRQNFVSLVGHVSTRLLRAPAHTHEVRIWQILQAGTLQLTCEESPFRRTRSRMPSFLVAFGPSDTDTSNKHFRYAVVIGVDQV